MRLRERFPHDDPLEWMNRAYNTAVPRAFGFDRDPGRQGFGCHPAGAFRVGEWANGDLRRDGDTAFESLRIDAGNLAGDADGLRSLAGSQPRRRDRSETLCGGLIEPPALGSVVFSARLATVVAISICQVFPQCLSSSFVLLTNTCYTQLPKRPQALFRRLVTTGGAEHERPAGTD